MTIYDWAQWVLLVISFFAEYLIIKKKVLGFYIWIGLCVGWFCIDFIAGLYGQSASWILYLIICLFGAKEWKYEDVECRTKDDVSTTPARRT